MVVRADFEHVSALQYKVRSLEHRVSALESGEAYAGLKATLSAREKLYSAKTSV